MKKNAILILSTILLITSAFQCKKDTEVKPTIDCTTTLCTADFREVNISVKDTKGNEVAMDEVIVTLDGKLESTVKTPFFGTKSSYTIADDGLLSKVDFTMTKSLNVVGKLNGAVKFTKDFIIFKDCCHIQMGKIDPEIIIQ
jgi:hypothetical protein